MAFPDTHNMPFETKKFYRKAQEWVMSNLSSAEPEDIENGDKEIFIDFRKKKDGELIIKLKDI